MKVIKIDEKKWADGLENAKSAYHLFGPIKNNDFSEFKELDKGELPDMTATDTRLSPKSVVFPQSEVMFEYTTDENNKDCNLLQVPEKNYSPRAIIGIRPYDAAAFLIVKKNFDTEQYQDPYWCNSYEACTFVGLAVTNPCPLDFSTSTNTGPFDEKGLDILLVESQDCFLAKILTEKGEAFITAAGWTDVADHAAEKQIDELKKQAEALITSKVSYSNIKSASIMDLYDASFWKDAGFACINCGTCTYVCPTCWCFDIQDENCGKEGKRFKNWDSCMYPLFTLHGTGHNPRGEKIMRVRQRFMHKLKYFLDKYNDGIMCVGCARCIRSCPVNIDIRRICELMNNHDTNACDSTVK